MSVDHQGRYGPHAAAVTYVDHPFAEQLVDLDLPLRANTQRLFTRGRP